MLSPELMRELDLLIEEDLPEEELEDCDFPDHVDCAPEKAHISAPAISSSRSMVSDLIRENLSLKERLDYDQRFALFSKRVFGPIAIAVHVFSIAGLLCWTALFAKVGYAVIQLVILLIEISNA